MVMLTVVSLDPVTVCVEDLLPYFPVMPYSNHTVVDTPFALTVPFSVAVLDVIFVAEPVVTVGGCVVVVALYVTVIVSVPEFPAPSLAVTVITLAPLDRLMLDIDQLVVPLAVPLPPLLLLHVTLLTLPELSDAVPLKVMVLLVVV